MDEFIKEIQIGLKIIIIAFMVVAIICPLKTFGSNWTIDDSNFN